VRLVRFGGSGRVRMKAAQNSSTRETCVQMCGLSCAAISSACSQFHGKTSFVSAEAARPELQTLAR
jgi:hypothetical protein